MTNINAGIGAILLSLLITPSMPLMADPGIAKPSFFSLYHDQLIGWSAVGSLHIRGHSHIKLLDANGKWIEAPQNGNFDLSADLPDLSRFVLKQTPYVTQREDGQGNFTKFQIQQITKTSDGSTLVMQQTESPRGDGHLIASAMIENYDPQKAIPIVDTGLVFLWPFNITFNEMWYGPLDSPDRSPNIVYDHEDANSYYYNASGVNIFSKKFDAAPRVNDVRQSYLGSLGKGLASFFGAAGSVSNPTFVPFKLVVQKLPGNPLKTLTISYASKPGGNDIISQTKYDVQDFMLVGDRWIPKRMTFESINKGLIFHEDFTIDEAEIKPTRLNDEEVKPTILSHTIVYDSRLKVTFVAGAAPEEMLRHFKVVDHTDGAKGAGSNAKTP